jgi:hypothetical protein
MLMWLLMQSLAKGRQQLFFGLMMGVLGADVPVGTCTGSTL